MKKDISRVPEFKAALHGGNVVVSEVGKYKSEIAYHGDVLNTTARILSKCHELQSELLVSDWVITQLEMPKYLKCRCHGFIPIKGKTTGSRAAFRIHVRKQRTGKEAVEGGFSGEK